MNKITPPLLYSLLALQVPLAVSQEVRPVESIRGATWNEYSGEYSRSPLCAKDEITLWSCSAGKRKYSLCSSRVVTRVEGYMQYRASHAGKTVLTFPATKRPPAGAFTYTSYPNGNASLEFVNKDYHYSLMDPLRSESSILVDAPSGKTTEILCKGNQTLQLNYTMRLMYDSGVWDR